MIEDSNKDFNIQTIYNEDTDKVAVLYNYNNNLYIRILDNGKFREIEEYEQKNSNSSNEENKEETIKDTSIIRYIEKEILYSSDSPNKPVLVDGNDNRLNDILNGTIRRLTNTRADGYFNAKNILKIYYVCNDIVFFTKLKKTDDVMSASLKTTKSGIITATIVPTYTQVYT